MLIAIIPDIFCLCVLMIHVIAHSILDGAGYRLPRPRQPSSIPSSNRSVKPALTIDETKEIISFNHPNYAENDQKVGQKIVNAVRSMCAAEHRIETTVAEAKNAQKFFMTKTQ